MSCKVMLDNSREPGKCSLCRPCCWVSYYSLCWLLYYLERKRKCHKTKHRNVLDGSKHVFLKQFTRTLKLCGCQRERPFLIHSLIITYQIIAFHRRLTMVFTWSCTVFIHSIIQDWPTCGRKAAWGPHHIIIQGWPSCGRRAAWNPRGKYLRPRSPEYFQ
jgi:hypothetical protein